MLVLNLTLVNTTSYLDVNFPCFLINRNMNKLNIEIVSCLQNQEKKPSLEVELYYNYTARGLDSYDVESLISRTHPE